MGRHSLDRRPPPARTDSRHGPAVVLVALLALLLHSAPSACGQEVAASQYPALRAILNSWGPFMPLADSWFVSTDCAQWLGLTCNAMGEVTELDISDRPDLLSGRTVPVAVSQLTALEKLSLNRNLLVGFIPSDIVYLTSLTNLSLSGNALTGSIPPGISALVNLQFVDLSTNSLSGPIPDSFEPMTFLNTLVLEANMLTGGIPASIFTLAQVEILLLGGNELTGVLPAPISGLKSLKALDVGRNYFYGSLPPELSDLPNLVFLDVSDNVFSGTPLPSFSSPSLADTAFATLDLTNNYFTSAPETFLAAGISFCPLSLKGAFASENLVSFGASPFGSLKANCFLNGEWNRSESYMDYRGGCNQRKRGGGGGAGNNRRRRNKNNRNGASSSSSGSSSGSSSSSSSGGVVVTSGIDMGVGVASASASATAAAASASASASASVGAGCSVEEQKRPIQCVSFCGAALPAGPCGGLGTCVLSGPSKVPTCICNSGMFNVTLTVRVAGQRVQYPSCSPVQITDPTPSPAPIDAANMRTRSFRGARLDRVALVSGSYYNSFFRYASVGFIGSYSAPRWSVPPTIDWRARMPSALTQPKDQGACSACWIMAPVAATEALYSIVYSQSPPNISEQKAIDCQGTWACEGGRPDDAFNYIAASGGLPATDEYPYTGVPDTETCKATHRNLLVGSNGATSRDTTSRSSGSSSTSSSLPLAHSLRGSSSRFYADDALPPAPFPISMFESVGISGWLGLALAVQNQPVVVNIEAKAESFVRYPGGFVYSDPLCFSTRVVDHLVLVVGFNLLDATPHWVIRNSWGPSWGESGYMRIAIAGGPGVCGMTSMPGLYPVLQTPDPCGPINPCGSGTCTVVGGRRSSARNRCTCPENFVAVTNLDRTQTCAVAKVCAFFVMNPCGFGTCVDDNRGGYNCLCSVGYNLGARTDGSATCIPGPTSVRVTLQAPMTCNQVRSTFLASNEAFTALNPDLICPGTIPSGTVVTIMDATDSTLACVVPYTIAQGDSCSLIASTFGISLEDLSQVNPDLDCSSLAAGQQVCIRSGSPQPQSCLNFYVVNPGETCSDIMINTYPPITAAQLYQYNPGIICSADASSQRLVGQEVCVDATPIVGAVKCQFGTYTVTRGDTCPGVVSRVFRSSYSLMYYYNPGWSCTARTLFVGKVLCRPKPA